jgi:hypothetical protein
MAIVGIGDPIRSGVQLRRRTRARQLWQGGRRGRWA